MPEHAYTEINVHVTWHVQDDQPVLQGQLEKEVHRYIYARAIEEPGVFVHEIGGTDDHIHFAVTIPPTVLISEWIGKLKGSSSHFINHLGKDTLLYWQRGYGVVTFGTRNLPWVIEYVRNQRQHHASGNLQLRMERTEPD